MSAASLRLRACGGSAAAAARSMVFTPAGQGGQRVEQPCGGSGTAASAHCTAFPRPCAWLHAGAPALLPASRVAPGCQPALLVWQADGLQVTRTHPSEPVGSGQRGSFEPMLLCAPRLTQGVWVQQADFGPVGPSETPVERRACGAGGQQVVQASAPPPHTHSINLVHGPSQVVPSHCPARISSRLADSSVVVLCCGLAQHTWAMAGGGIRP